MDEQLCLEIEEAGPAADLWNRALAHVEPALGREAVASWLKDAVPVSLQDGTLRVGVSNGTARTWIEKKYSRALTAALSELQGEELALEVTLFKGGKSKGGGSRTEKSVAAPPPVARRDPASSLFAPFPLNEKYTFANFVVGQSNRFAHAAAEAVAERPGREYNPLFIYGGVGLGKTHLLQAIGHSMLARDPRARVAYVSGETFTTHFVTSLRERKQEEFRRAYRGVDIWLVDDIQFIADKVGTKEEFFHTFNELYLTNRQIVLASDRPPRDLRLMEDRLRTRLESGLMVEIGPPDLETRMAIVQQRAELEGAWVPEEIVQQIARTVTSNVRVLEAALIRMLALASLNKCDISPDLAARALSAFVQESQIACVSLMAIQRAVCEHFKIAAEDLTGPRRDRHTSLARQVAMYLMRELSRKSLSEIGQQFGGKAHSTVLYSCTKLEKEMQGDETLQCTVRGIRCQLAGSDG